jgi:hypothetical protein
MLKKLLFIFATFIFLAVACQKDCVKFKQLEVTEFTFLPNSSNEGLFTTDIRNNGDTIRSVRNQFLINFSYQPYAYYKPASSWIQSAYAKDCPTLDFPVTNFDPLLTTFSVDKDIDPSFWGIGLDVIPAGTNLLAITEIRTRFLLDIRNNNTIHVAISAPVTLKNEFLSIFKGQRVGFTFSFSTKTEEVFTANTEAFIDVNA